jgi:hypothetical protein
MRFGPLVLSVLLWLVTSPHCFSEELRKELQDFPDANLTEQQWQNRVEDARRSSEQFAANARMRMSDPVQSDQEISKATDERAMSDSSLRSGDIVSTSKGFFIYVGRDDHEPGPNDFVHAPRSAVPVGHRPVSNDIPPAPPPAEERFAGIGRLAPLRLSRIEVSSGPSRWHLVRTAIGFAPLPVARASQQEKPIPPVLPQRWTRIGNSVTLTILFPAYSAAADSGS